MKPITSTEWVRLMEPFRGRKLAVHDELTRGVTIDQNDLRVNEALGWLIYHRLVTIEAYGLVPHAPAHAKRACEELGFANAAAQSVSGKTFAQLTPAEIQTKRTEAEQAAARAAAHQPTAITQQTRLF